MNAGGTPPLGGLEGGFILSPIFGATASENPTISIAPIEGEEFTRRLLTPLQESVVTLLLRQGVDVDLLLRLVAGEFRSTEAGKETAYANRPSDPGGYAVFRRVVLQLSTIQDRNALYAEPVDRTRKGVTGPIVITNYDPASLSAEERRALDAEAEGNSSEELTVDVRSGRTGGEMPIHGRFRLRSFNGILNFLGRSIADEKEYDVPPDHRTPPVSENPVWTMAIVESDATPRGAERAIRYRGRYYSLAPDAETAWNKEAFRLLYQIFQMTVGGAPPAPAPAITISK